MTHTVPCAPPRLPFLAAGVLCALLWAAPLRGQQSAAAGPPPPDTLTLETALREAMRMHPDLRAAAADVDAARGRRWREISPPPPELSWEYEFLPAGAPLSAYGERSIWITQEIEFPLATAFRLAARNNDIDARRARADEARRRTTAAVRAAWYRALAARDRVLLAEENLRVDSAYAQRAQVRYDLGEADNLARLTAQVQRSQSEIVLATAQGDARAALGALRQAIGRAAADSLHPWVLRDSLTWHAVPLSLTDARARGRAHPALVATQREVDAAAGDARAAWSSLLPSLSLGYARQADPAGADFHGVRFGLLLPLWFAFDHRGRIEEAQALQLRAEAARDATTIELDRRVDEAWNDLQNSARQVELHRQSILPQAEEIERAALRSLEAGESGPMELLLARRLVIQARTGAVDALLRHALARVTLEEITGIALEEQP